MSAQSPITNRWGGGTPARVQAEHLLVYRGQAGAAYNHHAQVTSLNGRLYATWSNGPTHEDEPGQRMLLATSDDAGRTWSPARILVDRQPGEDGVTLDRHYLLGDEPAQAPRRPGHHKGGRYGYPYCHVLGDTVVVIYSISKEDVAICRFPLQALG